MNYLVNVLSETGDQNIDTTVNLLCSKITKHKEEVINCIENVYKKYTNWGKVNKELIDEVEEISNDLKAVHQRIETGTLADLSSKHLQISTLNDELEDCKVSTLCVLSLLEVHEKLISAKRCMANDNCIQAAFELMHVSTLLNTLPGADLLDVVPALKSNVAKDTDNVEQVLIGMLNEKVTIKEGKAGLIQTYTIRVHKNRRELQDVINTLGMLHKLSPTIDVFRTSFWSGICKPILTNMTQIRTNDEKDFQTLTVVVKRTTPIKSYKDVFEKLLQAFTFIRTHLDYEITGETKFYWFIGKGVKVDLLQALLRDTLPRSDVNKVDSIVDAQQVVNDTRSFQQELVALEIFDEDNPILEYVNKMDTMLINQKCDRYTVDAITIMKKDLHDMVEVGVHFDADNPLTGDQFPQCSVSKSTLELLKKAETVLQDALKDSPLGATGTICALQSIFYQYGSIVYGHHEKLLQTIPQQVVLYRNNCMYLAHKLSQLNDSFGTRFPKEVLPVPPIFKDQPHQLRTIGGDIFLGYVETHITAMERLLSDYRFESHQLSENMSPDVDRCFRQCLRQYELLKTVWHKILPHAVYNKTIGYLLNAFCKNLLRTVLEAPDISVRNCELLVELYKIVLTRGPKLFTDPEEVNLYVDVWQKFNELVFVLTADLVSIENRWKNGPLSTHFKADEVKHMIRALFQTTDRRAYILSQIVSVTKF